MRKSKHYVLDQAERDPNDPEHWILGYARMSDPEHDDSPAVQAMKIRERAAELKGRYIGTWVDEGVSARVVPFDKRPGLLECLSVLRKGDDLVVNALDRLERGGFLRLANCLKVLSEKDVAVRSIHELGGARFDLNKLEMQPVIFMLSWAAEFYAQQTSERNRATREWRVANGYAVGPVAMGRRRLSKPHPENPKRTIYLDVWDEQDCQSMREIYRRHVIMAEPLASIGRDFKDCKQWNGTTWVPLRSKDPRRRKRSGWHYRLLHRACGLVQKCLDAGDHDHPLLSGWDGTVNGRSGRYTGRGK